MNIFPTPPASFAEESWYHGDVTNAELETLFANAAPGQFIVRNSTSRVRYCFTLRVY